MDPNSSIMLGQIDGKLDMVLIRMARQDDDIGHLRQEINDDLATLRHEVVDLKQRADERLRHLEHFKTRIVTYSGILSTFLVVVYELGKDYFIK